MWRLKIAAITAFLLISWNVDAQCKRFHKQTCVPTLPESHFLVNQFMLSNFFFGDEASVNFTVVPNKEYMLNLCTQDILAEGTYFQLTYLGGEVFYDSREHDYNNSIVFSSESGEGYTLRVANEKPREGEIIPSGCVSIVVGMKFLDETASAID